MRYILVGLRQAPAVCVIEPAMVVAAQPATLDIAVAEVGAAMSTMPIDEAVFAAQVLVENEILAHEPHRPRPGLLELAGAGDWPPIAAQQITHRVPPPVLVRTSQRLLGSGRLCSGMIGPGCYRTLAYSTGGAEMNTVGKTGETTSQRCRLKSYGPAARIVCAVSCPLAGAASTVPISGSA